MLVVLTRRLCKRRKVSSLAPEISNRLNKIFGGIVVIPKANTDHFPIHVRLKQRLQSMETSVQVSVNPFIGSHRHMENPICAGLCKVSGIGMVWLVRSAC